MRAYNKIRDQVALDWDGFGYPQFGEFFKQTRLSTLVLVSDGGGGGGVCVCVCVWLLLLFPF